MTGPRAHGDRRGFALVMVVFLLFAVAVAGVTGYQVVSSEFEMARQNRDGQEALAVARAGLERYVAESVGQVGGTVLYAIGRGIATVTAKRVLRQDSLTYLYYIESTGTVEDRRTPLLPAKRSVGTYAWHRSSPIRLKGAVWVSGGAGLNQRLMGTSEFSGYDNSTPADCAGGGTTGVRAIVLGAGTFSKGAGVWIAGPAPTSVTYGSAQAMIDTVGIRWDLISSPSFPVDFDGAPPNWASIPADSFPIVRYRGNLNANSSWSGHGVLIVTGTLTATTAGFWWDGIILAGQLGTRYGSSSVYPETYGMLIAGLNGSNPAGEIFGYHYYESCLAKKANRSLSYLQVVDNILFEVTR